MSIHTDVLTIKYSADGFVELCLAGFFVATVLRREPLNGWQAVCALFGVTFMVASLGCGAILLRWPA